MRGKQEPPELINPTEALKLFRYSGLDELNTSVHLYEAYYKTEYRSGFDFTQFLSFVYDTGRVQGIREERRKKRLSRKKSEAQPDRNSFYLTQQEEELLTAYRTCSKNNFRVAAEKLLKA